MNIVDDIAECAWFDEAMQHQHDTFRVADLRPLTDEETAEVRAAWSARYSERATEANTKGGATVEGTAGAATLGDERATGSTVGQLAPASSLALLLGFLDWLSTGDERVGPFDRNHTLDRAQASRLSAAYLAELA